MLRGLVVIAGLLASEHAAIDSQRAQNALFAADQATLAAHRQTLEGLRIEAEAASRGLFRHELPGARV